MDFSYFVPSSKSLSNRYLILKDHFVELNSELQAQAEDVVLLQKALSQYRKYQQLYVGEGGTTFRFLALYLSSLKGEWLLEGKKTLFRRPQQELLKLLEALGVTDYKFSDSSFYLKTEGWKKNQVRVSCEKSSQWATALLLTALTREKDFTLHLEKLDQASSYFEMTKKYLLELGFSFQQEGQKLFVPALQEPSSQGQIVEGDWSSAAFLYVLAALKDWDVELLNLEQDSLQPDSAILEILKNSKKKAGAFGRRSPLKESLQKNPDLFPVLCAYACFCQGESQLYGAPQLAFKESNRILKVKELLENCGYAVSLLEGGLAIKGEGDRILKSEPFRFDVSSDHRLFMACEVLKSKGYKVETLGQESIAKSFPEYLKLKAEHDLFNWA